MLRYLTAGESHGRALVAILEGIPAGVPVSSEDFVGPMALRQVGYGRGPRRNLECENVEVLSGIWKGLTIGSPISLLIWNSDQRFFAQESSGVGETEIAEAPLTVPIPGHADLAGALKYGFDDVRPVRERASARETAVRTAISVPALRLLEELGVSSVGFVSAIGNVPAKIPEFATVSGLRKAVRANERWFLTPDRKIVDRWKRLIDSARESVDSLGGIAEIRFDGLPAGLGSHVDASRRLDSRLAGVLMGFPAVHAVELGQGIRQSAINGKSAQDPIKFSPKTGWGRESNLSGGIEGGITNGEQLIVRCFMKPPPGACRVESADLRTGRRELPAFYRSDTAAPDSLAVVAQSAIAIELADCFMEKFGGDTLDDLRDSLNAYKSRISRLITARHA